MRNILLIALLAIVALLFVSGCGTYNKLVQKDTDVEESWGNVQNAYQRRADLIPNLVNTVKGAADFESQTLQNVIEARAKATSINVDASDITPENIQQFQNAQAQLGGALSKLLVTVERYPELKATQNFQELQTQLEGTENRIKVARDRFNKTVADYNVAVRSFPSNIFASLFGFSKMPMFESDPGAENTPDVNFDFQ